MTNRVLHFESGHALIVSDLQGNRTDFDRYLGLYFSLKERGLCDHFVILGDLIHGYEGYADESIYMLDKVIDLQKKDKNVVLLMGNHELSHVMHWNICKGKKRFTALFEKKIEAEREHYWRFLHNLPFAVSSKGGLFINHSGPSAALAGHKNELWDIFHKIYDASQWYQNVDFEKAFQMQSSHKKFWDAEFGRKILMRPEGRLLWDCFFNKNEYQYREQYKYILKDFITLINRISLTNVLISGHIEEQNGYKIVDKNHFRLCSSHGVTEEKNKKYLLVPIEKEIKVAGELTGYLNNLIKE